MSKKNNPSKRNRLSYWIWLVGADNHPVYVDVTSQINKPNPERRTKGLCALEIESESKVAAFSALNWTKAQAKDNAEELLKFPYKVTHVLIQQAISATETLDDNTMRVAFSPTNQGDMGGQTYELAIERPDSDTLDITDAGPTITLPRHALRFDVTFKSPIGYTITVGYAGYIGKPGMEETVGRVAGLALRSMLHLGNFKILARANRIDLPSRTQWTMTPTVMTSLSKDVVVALYEADGSGIDGAAGHVTIELDTANADAVTGRLKYTITPSEAVAERWDEAYAHQFHHAADTAVRSQLGGDTFVRELVDQIVLGELDDGALQRLDEALGSIKPLLVLPTEVKIWEGVNQTG